MPNITYKSCYFLYKLANFLMFTVSEENAVKCFEFVYTTNRKGVVIFTCRYFKLS